MRVAVRWVAGLLFAAFGASHALAQSGDGLMLVPDVSALACLDAGGGTPPAYPEREATSQRGAVVRVGLTFVAPDQPPKVKITFNSGTDEFADAVRDFLKAYRLPCLAAGAAAVAAVQEFQFVAGDGRKVIYGDLHDEINPKEEAARQCVTGMRLPRYPDRLEDGTRPEGTVIVKLRFVDGSSPPQASIVFDGGSGLLAKAVLRVVKDYRLPCLNTPDGPVTATQSFVFTIPGSTRYALKDVRLREFVGALDKSTLHPVRFDFSTMACPFDMRLSLLQPHAPNRVGEVEQSDPNRREFIEWLKTVSLKLPPEAVPQVIGQSLTISVPCGTLNLH